MVSRKRAVPPVRGRLSSTWNRRDRMEIGILLGAIALMHVLGFATLILLIAPRHYHAGTQVSASV